MNKNLGQPGNARTDEQRAYMEETIGEGKCPLCTVFNSDLNRVIPNLGEGKFWRAWSNPFPYPNHLKGVGHIILATCEHLTFADLTGKMFAELGLMQQAIIREYNLPGGGVIMRFGDNNHNAGTLTHVHAHIQTPNLEGPAFVVLAKLFAQTGDNTELIKSQQDTLIGAFTPR